MCEWFRSGGKRECASQKECLVNDDRKQRPKAEQRREKGEKGRVRGTSSRVRRVTRIDENKVERINEAKEYSLE